jgi:hypothetical protein
MALGVAIGEMSQARSASEGQRILAIDAVSLAGVSALISAACDNRPFARRAASCQNAAGGVGGMIGVYPVPHNELPGVAVDPGASASGTTAQNLARPLAVVQFPPLTDPQPPVVAKCKRLTSASFQP